jgi:hypothetical protein
LDRLRLILDSGAVLAESQGKLKIRALIRAALDDNAILIVPAIVVTETFRGESQDVLLNRLFKNVVVDTADYELAKVAGRLLAVTGTANAADAQVVANALRRAPCTILTSDEQDISLLVGGRSSISIVNVDRL